MAITQQGLRVRKLADRSAPQFDAVTGEPLEGPLPFAGLTMEGDPPKRCMLPTSFVDRGAAEGWIEVEGLDVVHRPGGPPEDLWRVTHTFKHAQAIVLKCVEGDVRYRVTHQPDKYVEGGKDTAEVTDDIYAAGDTRVDWYYGVELEASNG